MPNDVKMPRKREYTEAVKTEADLAYEGPSTAQPPPLKQVKVSDSGKVNFNAKKIVEKDPLQVLRDAIKVTSSDRQKLKLLLREFSTEHLIGLPDTSLEEAAVLILKLLNATKNADIAESCLRSLNCLLEKSHITRKLLLWKKIDSGLDEKKFYFQPPLNSSLMKLYELAIAYGVFDLNESAINANAAKQLCQRILRSKEPIGRISAIKFLIRYTVREGVNLEKLTELEKELREFCDDQDPRVRTTAVEGLESLCDGKRGFSRDSYKRVTELCTNSDINVRLIALRILLKFAQLYPDERVYSSKKFTLRLHDDAFTIVCHTMNDLDTKVRAEAARLLGCFTQVSDPFLLQTLDKKLIKEMRINTDGSTAAQSVEWSTGKKLGEPMMDIPMEREEETQSLIPIQACGAFVTALEDEFMAVRQPAVYSLGKLAVYRKEFARVAIDHLADMFNDEIAMIRLDAIHALTPLVVHGKLGTEQLNTILTGLDDAAVDNRMALHELLARSKFATDSCVKQCLQVLLRTLKRFPTDKQSTYKCLASIGLRHAEFVQTMVVELFGITPIFDMQEQSIEDEIYLAKLILILNAASERPAICSIAPAYARKHYRFLRCASPHLAPKVKDYEESTLDESSSGNSVSTIDLRIQSLLDNTYKRMVEAHTSARISEKASLFKLILRDLEAYQVIEEEIAVPARFLHDLCNVMNLFDVAHIGIRSGDDLKTIYNIIHQMHRKIGWIQYQYVGVDRKILAALRECSFFINLLQVVIILEAMTNLQSGQANVAMMLRSEVESFEARLMELDAFPSEMAKKPIQWLKERLSLADSKSEDKKDFITGQGILLQLVGAHIPVPEALPTLKKIYMKTIKVVEPNKDTQVEKVVKFVSGLPTGIKLNGMLNNLTESDIERFRIKIEYPDETITYFRPKLSEFTKLSDRLVRIQTTVLVAAQLWAESSEIQLYCGVLLVSPNGISIGANDYQRENFFVPLPDADEPTHCNKISIKIHPVNRM